MTKQPAIAISLDTFLNETRSQGRYSFGLEELKQALQVSNKAVNQALYRAKTREKVAQVRKGFYAILSPEYTKQGMVPPTLLIDDMMKMLNRRYYVGLISAAALHGAAHQQPMEYFVITQKPALRNIKNKKLKINFYVKKDWSAESVIEKKTDAGYINVSSPELTALDLLFYMDAISLNNTLTILKELTQEIKPAVLQKTASKYPQVATIQRLGYILDKELKSEKLGAVLLKVLKDKNVFSVPMSNSKIKDGSLDEKWKVINNTNIEADI
ncbi:MAG: type IV toxin-antitoxin system AbiEi family antitoxin [Chitinophagaceae bacterium]